MLLSYCLDADRVELNAVRKRFVDGLEMASPDGKTPSKKKAMEMILSEATKDRLICVEFTKMGGFLENAMQVKNDRKDDVDKKAVDEDMLAIMHVCICFCLTFVRTPLLW